MRPYSVDTSSSDDTIKVSEIIPAPIATDPLSPATTSLKLSNVPNAIMRALPVFGAAGFT